MNIKKKKYCTHISDPRLIIRPKFRWYFFAYIKKTLKSCCCSFFFSYLKHLIWFLLFRSRFFFFLFFIFVKRLSTTTCFFYNQTTYMEKNSLVGVLFLFGLRVILIVRKLFGIKLYAKK